MDHIGGCCILSPTQLDALEDEHNHKLQQSELFICLVGIHSEDAIQSLIMKFIPGYRVTERHRCTLIAEVCCFRTVLARTAVTDHEVQGGLVGSFIQGTLR